jgi:hypothetical protein
MPLILPIVALVLLFFFVALLLQLAPSFEGDVVDIMTPLFSTATFSLFIIAAAIGILTLVLSLFGREWIQNQIDQKVAEKAETERRNIGGYIMAHFGFVFGSLYREHENDFPQFLDNAIELSYLAKETLNEEHPSYKVAENNFAFYAALRGKARHAPECVRIGNRLRASANAPPDKEEILTYLQIVVRFSDYFEPPDWGIRDACRLARQLLEEQDASEGQRQKAEERLNQLLAI